MSSRLEIYNMALSRISEAQLESVDQGNESSRACNLHWNQALEEVLRDYEWNSCTHRAKLVALEEAPLFQYKNAFALPVDHVRVIEIYDKDGVQSSAYKYVSEGGVLLCDLDEVYIKYIRVIKDTVKFESLLTAAIILKLAEKMAFAKTDSRLLVESLTEAYEFTLQKAISIDTLENNDHMRRIDNEWLNSRGGML